MLEILTTFADVKLSIGVSKSLVNHAKRRDVFVMRLLFQVDIFQLIDRCGDFPCMDGRIAQSSNVVDSGVTKLGRYKADFDLLDLIWIVNATHHRHL